MAKQAGDIIIIGTIDDITFYVMEGKGYARKKSRLTGKRVKRDPKFKRTMQSAHRLGRASQLASKVYRSLPRKEQVYTLYKKLKSAAVLALKEGKAEEEVAMVLQQCLSVEGIAVGAIAEKKKAFVIKPTPSFTKKVLRVPGGGRRRVIPTRRRKAGRVQVLRE